MHPLCREGAFVFAICCVAGWIGSALHQKRHSHISARMTSLSCQGRRRLDEGRWTRTVDEGERIAAGYLPAGPGRNELAKGSGFTVARNSRETEEAGHEIAV